MISFRNKPLLLKEREGIYAGEYEGIFDDNSIIYSRVKCLYENFNINFIIVEEDDQIMILSNDHDELDGEYADSSDFVFSSDEEKDHFYCNDLFKEHYEYQIEELERKLRNLCQNR